MKRGRWPIAVGVLLACLGLSGCYERVVESHGIGSEGVDTYEPNLRQGENRRPLDHVGDAIFGPVE